MQLFWLLTLLGAKPKGLGDRLELSIFELEVTLAASSRGRLRYAQIQVILDDQQIAVRPVMENGHVWWPSFVTGCVSPVSNMPTLRTRYPVRMLVIM
jgi:hypothetical protein